VGFADHTENQVESSALIRTRKKGDALGAAPPPLEIF
jgi:hypothetical protein